MEYILLIHKNDTKHGASADQWNEFIVAARKSGVFSGGSAISPGELIGAHDTERLSERLAGHMRFSTRGVEEGKKVIEQLLKLHPTVVQGGTVELCEMPETQ